MSQSVLDEASGNRGRSSFARRAFSATSIHQILLILLACASLLLSWTSYALFGQERQMESSRMQWLAMATMQLVVLYTSYVWRGRDPRPASKRWLRVSRGLSTFALAVAGAWAGVWTFGLWIAWSDPRGNPPATGSFILLTSVLWITCYLCMLASRVTIVALRKQYISVPLSGRESPGHTLE